VDYLMDTGRGGPVRDAVTEIDSPTLTEIDRLLADHPGGLLMRRDAVVDHRLDLRATAAGAEARAAVDRSLARIPGRTVVEVGWWSAELSDLRDRVSGAA
jgi:hypothetical protein